MSVTYGQLKDRFRPVLARKKFRISDLNGLLGERVRKDLKLARAFAVREGPENAGSSFARELKKASPHLRKPMTDAIARLRQIKSPSLHDREKCQREIQLIFADHGISADWGRPSSVGVILRTADSLDVPTHYVLGESAGSSPFTGRLKVPQDGDPGAIYLNITGSISRLKDHMDLYFYEVPSEYDSAKWSRADQKAVFEQALVWGESERLKRLFERMQFDARDHDATAILSNLAKRKFACRLLDMMEKAQTTDQFFLMAINAHLDATRSHEGSHLVERRINHGMRLEGLEYELLAYLMQASFSTPDLAFINLFDAMPLEVEKYMPDFADEILVHRNEIFFKNENYIRGWAKTYLKAYFNDIAGKDISRIPGRQIRSLNTSDHVTQDHLPLITEALCHTDAMGRHVELTG